MKGGLGVGIRGHSKLLTNNQSFQAVFRLERQLSYCQPRHGSFYHLTLGIKVS